MLIFDVRYTVSAEHIADALQRAPLRRASKKRLIGQTVALGFVFAWCMTAFILDETHQMSSLFIALAAAALGVVMWVVPKLELRRIINEAAEDTKPMHLWVLENGIDFGEEVPEKPYYEFAQLTWFLPNERTADTLVWRLPSYDVVVVPKEHLTDEQWTWLLEKAT